MTAPKSGWRSLIARVRGKKTDDRPETLEDLPAESGETEDVPRSPPDDESAAREPEEEDDDLSEKPEAGDETESPAEERAEEKDTAEEAGGGEPQAGDGEDESEVAGPRDPMSQRRSREESLEAEIRTLRLEVARLESSLEALSAARQRMAEEVEALADHDPLTGLATERRFSDRLSMAIVHAQRHKQKVAVVQLGIDRFGKINDKLGRSLGDDVLKSVALALESTLRQGDTIARFSGDVFTLLLPGLKRDEDMTMIADKLRLALRSPFSIGGHDLLLTASLGAALFPDDGPSVESLLHNATVALKRAKERGGDSWDVHAPRSRALAAERQARESALRRALVQNDLELSWQPVVECETGAIVGVEALLRWADPGEWWRRRTSSPSPRSAAWRCRWGTGRCGPRASRGAGGTKRGTRASSSPSTSPRSSFSTRRSSSSSVVFSTKPPCLPPAWSSRCPRRSSCATRSTPSSA